jgi:hypothetical protein
MFACPISSTITLKKTRGLEFGAPGMSPVLASRALVDGRPRVDRARVALTRKKAPHILIESHGIPLCYEEAGWKSARFEKQKVHFKARRQPLAVESNGTM